MIAVEHDHERGLQLGEQALKVAPREYGQSGLIFRREQWQALALARLEIGRGERKVVEESRDVGVAVVELIPEIGNRRVLEPACGKGGLAAPRRSRYPDRRAFACAIEQREQALARQNPRQARARGLAERHPSGFHRVPSRRSLPYCSPPATRREQSPRAADRPRRASHRQYARSRASRWRAAAFRSHGLFSVAPG